VIEPTFATAAADPKFYIAHFKSDLKIAPRFNLAKVQPSQGST